MSSNPWLDVSVSSGTSEIVKCCPLNQSLGPAKTCEFDNSEDPTVICQRPTCTFSVHMVSRCDYGRYVLGASDIWQLTPSGVEMKAEGSAYVNPQYCVEDFVNVSGKPRAIYPIMCHMLEPSDRDADPDDPIKELFIFEVYPILQLISAAFLLLTILLYVTVVCQHSRNTLRQKIVNIFYQISILMASVMVAVQVLFIPPTFSSTCQIFGFAVQFFFLATFFWLNVMCIDIYWAFSDLRSLGGSGSSWRDKKKLLCYSAYAWGMPLLILCITIAADYSPSIPTSSRFKPAMGLDKCFFRGRIAGWVYFYGPMAVILLMNCVLFASTAFHLHRHRRNNGVFRRGDSRRHGGGNDTERFNLYLKLFIVMGINWLFEVISFTFNKDVPSYLWYITDITNTLQGVFIFLIFVWKQRVRQLIWDKLCKGNRAPSSGNNTSSTSAASTRSHHNSINMNTLSNISGVPLK